MKLVLLFLLCFVGLQSFAQKWCPPGAEWVYFSGGWYEDAYIKLLNEKDTLVLQQPCKKLTHNVVSYNYTFGTPPKITKYKGHSIYTYSTKDTVFIFNNGKFEAVYFFNAQVGDTLKFGKVDCANSKKLQYVDSKGFEIVNNDTLKYYIIKFVNDVPYGYYPDSLKIYERLGPIFAFIYPSFSCATDASSWSLQCYYDNEIGEYKPNPNAKCWEATSIDEIGILEVVISPNPAINNLNITSSFNAQIESISIIDINGVIINNFKKSNAFDLSNIDIMFLNDGLYIFQLQTSNGTRYIRKFVKQSNN